jgi:hypothetical protein
MTGRLPLLFVAALASQAVATSALAQEDLGAQMAMIDQLRQVEGNPDQARVLEALTGIREGVAVLGPEDMAVVRRYVGALPPILEGATSVELLPGVARIERPSAGPLELTWKGKPAQVWFSKRILASAPGGSLMVALGVEAQEVTRTDMDHGHLRPATGASALVQGLMDTPLGEPVSTTQQEQAPSPPPSRPWSELGVLRDGRKVVGAPCTPDDPSPSVRVGGPEGPAYDQALHGPILSGREAAKTKPTQNPTTQVASSRKRSATTTRSTSQTPATSRSWSELGVLRDGRKVFGVPCTPDDPSPSVRVDGPKGPVYDQALHGPILSGREAAKTKPTKTVAPSSTRLKGKPSKASAWRKGKRLGPIQVVRIDGKPVEVKTAKAYLAMRAAARMAGIRLRLNSGFRSHAQQRRLYRLYLQRRGNKAAPPGYSNHQDGRALDIQTGGTRTRTYRWLEANARGFGFVRTVKGEPWHWEYRPGR